MRRCRPAHLHQLPSLVIAPHPSQLSLAHPKEPHLSAASGVHSQVSLNDLSTFLERENWDKISDAQQCLIQAHSSTTAQRKPKYYLNALP